MSTSKQRSSSSIITATIKVNGSSVKDVYMLEKIEVINRINKIPLATISFFDDDLDTATFSESGFNNFIPGNEIEILAGYYPVESSIFSGVIYKQNLSISMDGEKRLNLICMNRAHLLTIGKKSVQYSNKSDDQVIKEILSSAGLSGEVDFSSIKHQVLIQNNRTDWEFLLERAAANGFLVGVEHRGKKGDDITVQKPDMNASPDFKAVFGESSILAVDATLDASYQVAKIKAQSWDPETQKAISVVSEEPALRKQGNLSGKKLAAASGSKTDTLQTIAPLSEKQLTMQANAALPLSRLSSIYGNVTLSGEPDLVAGMLIELSGFGNRFDGKAFISGVHHTMENGQWTTTVTFGLLPEFAFGVSPSINNREGNGLQAGFNGLQIGKVKQIDQDSGGQFRVLVTMPIIDASEEGIWARLSGAEGANITLEENDEVVLGFLDDDPRYPTILGCLSNPKQNPQIAPGQKKMDQGLI